MELPLQQQYQQVEEQTPAVYYPQHYAAVRLIISNIRQTSNIYNNFCAFEVFYNIVLFLSSSRDRFGLLDIINYIYFN